MSLCHSPVRGLCFLIILPVVCTIRLSFHTDLFPPACRDCSHHHLYTVFLYLLLSCSPFPFIIKLLTRFVNMHCLYLPQLLAFNSLLLPFHPSISLKLLLSKSPMIPRLSALTRPSTLCHTVINCSSFLESTVSPYPHCSPLSAYSFSVSLVFLQSTTSSSLYTLTEQSHPLL